MKPFFKVFTFGGYPFDVAVALGFEKEALEKRLRRLGGLADDECLEEMVSIGRTSRLPNGAYLMQLTEPPDTVFGMGLLIHEAFHVVTFLMRDVGINLTDDSDEAFAYALQDITQQVVAAMVPTVKRRPRR